MGDFNGFVREVVTELQTVSQEQGNNDDGTQFNEEEAIEQELKHQLLQLSDDEDGGSEIRTLNAEEYHNDQITEKNDQNNETELDEQKKKKKKKKKKEEKKKKKKKKKKK